MRPSSNNVYRRLMILKYLVIHSYSCMPGEYLKEFAVQWTASQKDEYDRELDKTLNESISSMKNFGLWSYVTQTEKDFFTLASSKMDGNSQMNANWRMEAAAILMWALKLLEQFPEIAVQTSPELLKIVEIKKIGLFSRKQSLRSKAEIVKMRNIYETWHWRVNTRRLIEQNFDFQPDENMKKMGFNSLDDIVKITARSAYKNGHIDEIINDDFVFKGKPFRDLDEMDFIEATSIIIERHYALNWLCGYAPNNDWDETPTDT